MTHISHTQRVAGLARTNAAHLAVTPPQSLQEPDMPPSKRDARIAALKVFWLVDAKNNPALRAQTQTKIDELTRGKK